MRRYFIGLLLIYFLLVTIYSLTVPLFEAPDEYYHFAVIEHIARTGRRPSTVDVHQHPWRQMVYHAPLYHFIGAALIRPINTDDFLSHYPLNPHAQIGEPSAKDNVNFVAHTGDPWRNTGLAVRVLRGFSMMLGAVTLTGTYLLARAVFPNRPGVKLLAVSVVLFNPQFLFVSAVVNNDNLVVALATLGLAWLVYLMRMRTQHNVVMRFQERFAHVFVLAVLAAWASLAKASGLAIYVPVMLGMLWICYRDRVPLVQIVLYALMGIAVFEVIAGWWYVENWRLYGDPTASSMVAEATGSRGISVDIPGEMRGLYYSFWGLFGWFNIPAPQIYYQYTVLLLIGAGVGVMRHARKQRHSLWGVDDVVIGLVLAVYALTVIVSWWQFNLLVLAGQGRLWFPLLGVMGCIVGWGLRAFDDQASPLVHRVYPLTLVLPLVIAAVTFPYILIKPAYAAAKQIPVDTWHPPADAVAVAFREPWAEAACMTLWVTPVKWNGASSVIELDVAWEARCPVTGFWSVFVHFSDIERESCEVGDTRHVLSQRDTMPDDGNTPFPAIKPGFLMNDHIEIALSDDLDESRQWHLQMGLYDAGGTFIRAFVVPDDGSSLLTDETIFVGRCSPELVNLRLVQ